MDAAEAVKYAFPVAIRVSYPSEAPGEPTESSCAVYQLVLTGGAYQYSRA
jgi:hypothetical protein